MNKLVILKSATSLLCSALVAGPAAEARKAGGSIVTLVDSVLLQSEARA